MAALAAVPALSLAGPAEDAYIDEGPLPGNDGGSEGGSGGTAAPPSTGGSVSEAPDTGGGTIDGTGSGGSESDASAVSPTASAAPAGEDPVDDAGKRDRNRDRGADKTQLARIQPLGDITDRPTAALSAQAATSSGLGIVPLLIGILLVVTALAIILRQVIQGRVAPREN